MWSSKAGRSTENPKGCHDSSGEIQGESCNPVRGTVVRVKLNGIGVKAPSLERIRAWRRAGLFLRVGVLCLYTPPTCAKLISVVQIPRWRALNSEIIPARARNRACAGNNWLGCCPHSERLFATQIEKTLTNHEIYN